MRKVSTKRILMLGSLAILGLAALVGPLTMQALTQEAEVETPLLFSLKQVPVPMPPDLDQYVVDMEAAVTLGKALFWDMQVGSDGVTACASCHYQAGADVRAKNSVSPGLLAGDTTFHLVGPNATLTPQDFPLHRLLNPDDYRSQLLADSNDVISSMGAFAGAFKSVRRSHPQDQGTPLMDEVFQVGGVTVRQVEPRNAPTVVNAVFNHANFWDGRANFYFNGVNPHGPMDTRAVVFVNVGGQLQPRQLRIAYSSLASQAVAPPMSGIEMSLAGRTWPDVGRKLMNLRPLGRQMVHPQDSVLGSLTRARLNGTQASGLPGLRTTYASLVRQAFRPEYWSGTQRIRLADGQVVAPTPTPQPGEYTQIEANFSLFFGLALQLYQATLVSDDTPFDRYLEGDAQALTARQVLGLDVFVNQGNCASCHVGPELTAASVANLTGQRLDADGGAEGPVELMQMFQGVAFYDTGFYNIAVRPTAEDVGRGANTEFINPVTGQPLPLSLSELGLLKHQGLLPAEVAAFVPDLPNLGFTPDRTAVHGATKVPTLRNVELTGPYMRNGGMSTLRQVVDFYNRGGDFPDENLADLSPAMVPLNLSEPQKQALVAFMQALTDERVRQDMAPFDHPQLFIPLGLVGDQNDVLPQTTLRSTGFASNEEVLELPAIGAGGRPAAGLPAPGTFLNLQPHTASGDAAAIRSEPWRSIEEHS